MVKKIYTAPDEDPQKIIEETEAEIGQVFKKQQSGFMGFINRIFGGKKIVDEMEQDFKKDMDELKKDVKDHQY